ncbi:MipA/OmpV family protein [Microbulbifer sp. SAOS-129_SWC]|uniref:MipA/OmpV family protein n=1 Tax=Microbulbifer sp. SAOS-129_SWC TaxID=3145235 RepID=UPI0032173F9D
MYTRIRAVLLALLAQLNSVTATAAPTEDAPTWEFGIALGAGVLENPLADHESGETFFLPSFSYYGDRFFVSNLTVGYALVENENFYVDLVARPNEDGLYYKLDKDAVTTGSLTSYLTHLSAPEVGDIDRDVSVMGGPSFTWVNDYVDVSFAWFHDISNVHQGTETHLSLDKRYPLLDGAIGLSLGATQKDADLVRYYYHFTDSEAGVFAPRYARLFPAGDVTDLYARVHFSYPLSKRFELRLAARYNHLDLSGRNPRFIDKPETLSWFAGIQYTFGGE